MNLYIETRMEPDDRILMKLLLELYIEYTQRNYAKNV